MSKTNFDDIELTTPGIEAREINTESATAGQVLTADGAGGAVFAKAGALLRVFHGSEDQFSSGTWIGEANGYVEVSDPGFTYDETSGEITIGPELEGKRLILHAQSGAWSVTQAGTYKIGLQRKTPLGFFSTIATADRAVAVGADPVTVVVDTMWAAEPGDKWRVRFFLTTPSAGTAEWSLDDGHTAILAV